MKSRAEVIAKANEFADAQEGSVENEAHFILLDIAGHEEADMCSPAGVDDLLFSLEQEEGTVAEAARLVGRLLK